MHGSSRSGFLACGALLAAMLVAAAAGEASAASPVWTRIYDGAPDATDVGFGVAVAADGSVYAAGYTTRASQSHNLLLCKYSPSGARLWVKTFNGALNDADFARAVAVGPDQGVYVVGATNAVTNKDLLLRKYAPGGRLLWQRTYDSPGSLAEDGSAVAVGADGSVYVAGGTDNVLTGYDLLLIKYTASGARRWVKTYNSPGNGFDNALGVAVAGNSVYVVGRTQPPGRSSMLLLHKYTTAGALVWSRTLDKSATGADYGNAVAVDSRGDVYVTGGTRTVADSTSLVLRKYSSSGATRWTRYYGNPLGGDAEGAGVAVAADGTIAVAGSWATGQYDGGVLLLRYSPAGHRLQGSRYIGGAGAFAMGLGVATGTGRTAYVAGLIGRKGVPGSGKLLLQKYQ